MSRRIALGALASGLLLALACPAWAWTPISGSRPTWCGTVPYSMQNAGSADLGADTTETAVRQGMDDWTRVSCVSLTSNYLGRTGTRPGSYEGTSVIGWIESGWPHDPNAIGVTGPAWAGSCIREADMQLNGVNYTWTTAPGRGGTVNTYSIVLHESGHYYGLGHSSDSSACMYFAYGGGISALNADDRTGICALYPGSGPSDCTVTGCPSGQECVDGSCRTITGDGTVCSPCMGPTECGGAADYCIRYPDGAGYCGKACTNDSNCGPSEMCFGTDGAGSQCIRVIAGRPSCASAPPPGCSTDSDCASTERCNTSTGNCEPRPVDRAGLGEPCETNDDCNSGVCLARPEGSACTQSCDWLDPTSCPGGFYCNGTAAGSCGPGLCLSGSAGAAALGEACAVDTDCATLLCSSGLCGSPCIPDGAAGCPEGYTCQVGVVMGCGACRVASALGEPCDTNEVCASRMCAVAGARTFCTQLCDDASTCPEGFTCAAAGDVSVCVPPERGGDGARGGCGCRVPGHDASNGPAGALGFLLALALLVARRRREKG